MRSQHHYLVRLEGKCNQVQLGSHRHSAVGLSHSLGVGRRSMPFWRYKHQWLSSTPVGSIHAVMVTIICLMLVSVVITSLLSSPPQLLGSAARQFMDILSVYCF